MNRQTADGARARHEPRSEAQHPWWGALRSAACLGCGDAGPHKVHLKLNGQAQINCTACGERRSVTQGRQPS